MALKSKASGSDSRFTWYLIEWPRSEAEPTKYFLATLPANISLRDMVNTAKLRWRIERDYQDLKG